MNDNQNIPNIERELKQLTEKYIALTAYIRKVRSQVSDLVFKKLQKDETEQKLNRNMEVAQIKSEIKETVKLNKSIKNTKSSLIIR